MARLRLSLLGSFQATLDGRPLRGFEGDKGRALLAYLAVESDRDHRREALADLLWPECAPAAARANLRNTLANLHTVLGDREEPVPFLHATSQLIGFGRESDHEVDVLAFEALLQGDPQLSHLEEAITLYRGDFLAGFSPKDSSPFEDWVLLVRERLRREYLETLRRLVARHGGSGDGARALEAARRWAEADPWDEAAQRELMHLLALGGQRSAALVRYEQCAEELAAELGVEPEAATTQLYERIRDGQLDPTPGPRASARLPLPSMPLIGRERELEEALSYLREPSCRLLTILGAGGAGKTRLALEVARRLAGELGGDVCLVPLAAVERQEELAVAIARELGVAFYRQQGAAPQQQLLLNLRDRELLLWLDGCDRVSGSGELIAEILRFTPNVRVLATSRTRLGLLGEQCLVLEGLDEAAAARLFVASARRVRPGYAPDEAEMAGIAQVCRWADGVPLGVLLASAWIELLSPAEILAQMGSADRQRLDLLEADFRDLPEQQRSMRAVFDQSWSLLSERAQGILAALSVFRGGFTAEAAQAVSGAGLRDLLYLANRSLLQRLIDQRYGLLELLRRYGQERLAARGELEMARDRHAAYYAGELAHRAAGARRSRASFLRDMDGDAADHLAAWAWATERRELAWLDQAADALSLWLSLEQQIAEGDRLLGAAIAAVRELPPSGPQARVAAKLLCHQAAFKERQGDLEAQRALAREAAAMVAEAQRAGEAALLEQARATRRMAQVAASPEEGRALLEQAAALAHAAGDKAEEAYALRTLGTALPPASAEEAWHALERSIGLWRELGDPFEAIQTLCALGFHILRWGGREERLGQLAGEVHELLREVEDPISRARVAHHLASMYNAQGQAAQARAVLEEAIRANEEAGNRWELAHLHQYLAHELLESGEYPCARDHLERSLALAHEQGNRAALYAIHYHLNWLAAAEGKREAIERAERLFEEFCATHYGPNTPASADWPRALAACALGRLGEARQRLLALARFVAAGGWVGEFRASFLPVVALLWARQGRLELALELDALCQGGEPGGQCSSAFHQAFFHRPIQQAAASQLAPEAIAAAQERGRRRDRETTLREVLAELEQG